MNLKPWRELVTPHKDVLDGTFKQSEFAADLTQVHSGAAPEDYMDPEKFYSRTVITEGMKFLLDSVAKRLANKGGDPVIQLQTAFGGGKTHTLLAVYHLAARKVPLQKLRGIPPLLDQAGITDLPQARIAVIDGVQLSPSEPRKRSKLEINTLWGELAFELLGEDGYRMVEKSDKAGVSPGKEVLVDLVKKASPCVILMDELVAYFRNFDDDRRISGGTYGSNITFTQALTESLKSVPNAVLLASLPESEIEAGGATGKLALNALEKYFARVESVWKPVGALEAFEIVKRRLFESPSDSSQIEQVCRSFHNIYAQDKEKFPVETRESSYLERLLQAYPIHPEIFDRLYEDWSTLEKFQRTRGVLQYMAVIIHRLWNSDNRDYLIMPGSIPLEDANVRTKSLHYLPQGWEPVVESEIDGPRSTPFEIDGREPRLGSLQASRRVARTIFLGSAPSRSVQGARGIQTERVLLGVTQPGSIVAVFEDALRRLKDRLQYLFSSADRVWFDTRPNLRREMESRKQRFEYQSDILPLLRKNLQKIFKGDSGFGGIHIFAATADIPDEVGSGVRLVILPPELNYSYSRNNAETAFAGAQTYLDKRGESPRQKRNRLIFLAPDYEMSTRLKDQTTTYLAWNSIVEDSEAGRINLDGYQLKEGKQSLDSAEKYLNQMLKDTYKWVFNAYQDFSNGKPELKWETASVSLSSGNPFQIVQNKLKEEEWVIYSWSPIHLSNILKQWYLKEGKQEVNTEKLVGDFSSYLYLPRLNDDTVLRDAIAQGVMSEDFFGYAAGKEGERHLGFVFGGVGSVVIDSESLLIDRELAKTLKGKQQGPFTTNETSSKQESIAPHGLTTTSTTGSGQGPGTEGAQRPKLFYAIKELNPVKAKMDFVQIVDEVLIHLTQRSTTNVGISIEINAQDEEEGFDGATQRTIKENCNQLGFKASEFNS